MLCVQPARNDYRINLDEEVTEESVKTLWDGEKVK